MFETLTRSGLAALTASGLVLLAPAVASAQGDQLGIISPATGECVPATECDGVEADAACTDEGGHCVRVSNTTGATLSFCRPAGVVLCCSRVTQATYGCPHDFTCMLLTGAATGMCVPAGPVYCGKTHNEAGPDVVRDCHTSPEDEFPVHYDKGDCDRDGEPNIDDPRACSRYGLWIEGDGSRSCSTADARALACADDEPEGCEIPGVNTGGICTTSERTGGRPLCSIPPHVFCCGTMENAECPVESDCVLPEDRDDAIGYCTNVDYLCRPYTAQRLKKCHSDLDGNLTTAADGDCDGDGHTNAEDPDPCNPPDDGGMHLSDAGPATDDAGAGMDGGSAAKDAGGTPLNPSFAGGGGCTCRSAPGGPGDGVRLGLALLGLALLVRRR